MEKKCGKSYHTALSLADWRISRLDGKMRNNYISFRAWTIPAMDWTIYPMGFTVAQVMDIH